MTVTRRGWITLAVVGVLLVAAGYGAGRFAAPTKETVKVETEWKSRVEYVEVEKKVEVRGPVRVRERRVEVPGPQGPTVYVDRTEDQGPVTTTTDTGRTGTMEEQGREVVEKTVTRDAPRFGIFGTAAAGFEAGAVTTAVGVAVTYRVAGPFTLMLQGEGGASGGSARVGVGLTF